MKQQRIIGMVVAMLAIGITFGLNSGSNIFGATMETSNATGVISNSTDTTISSQYTEQIQHLNEALTAINNNDDKGAKTHLLKAENMMEDMTDKTAEKRVEAALKMLKEGDKNASISHIEEAIKILNSS